MANLFKIDTTIYSDKPKILKEVDILDSVWVKDSEDVIWSGWVYAKEKDRIIVTYSDLGEQLKDVVVLTKDEKTAVEAGTADPRLTADHELLLDCEKVTRTTI